MKGIALPPFPRLSTASRRSLRKYRLILELYMPRKVAELHESISALDFYRSYVSKNLPVLVKGGAKHWRAIEKWSVKYFREKMGNKMVKVAVTPNGYADAVGREMKRSGQGDAEYFLMPEERCLGMSEFLERLERPREDSIFYLQRQNSNLEDFPELWEDIEAAGISWAAEAFVGKPDAVNFWMGDERAVTSSCVHFKRARDG
jgi:jumonji domain-containing protein 7